ncbi:MAG: hypothetical protein ACLSXC_00785 [Beduini sp.]
MKGLKVLMIGGTGTISTPICEALVKDEAFDYWCDKVIERYNAFVESMEGEF